MLLQVVARLLAIKKKESSVNTYGSVSEAGEFGLRKHSKKVKLSIPLF